MQGKVRNITLREFYGPGRCDVTAIEKKDYYRRDMDCRGGENRSELEYDVEIESIDSSDALSAGVIKEACQR